MKVIRIDENGFYVEDVILEDWEEIPSDCVAVEPDQESGFHRLKFNRDTNAWEEGLTAEEITQIVTQSSITPVSMEALQNNINDLQYQVDYLIINELMGV